MRNDEGNLVDADLGWLDENSFDATRLTESMDFGPMMGDVVPRDGLQRPLLTSGSTTHAPAARRASTQPIHVTHVHQTFIQSNVPLAAALPATAAESTSGLSCLERTLSVPQGSIYPGASKWKHRNKSQMAAGIAPHAHDGAMMHGTSMPAPLPAEASEVDDTLCLLSMPHPVPAHATRDTHVAPKISQRVLDVIARSAMVQHTPAATITALTSTPTTTPTAQVGGSRIAEAMARHAAVEAERSEAERTTAQVERDRCAATARLLASAGWCDRAVAVMAAAPAIPHTPAPRPTTKGKVMSLQPNAVHGTARSTVLPSQGDAVTAWKGSLVGASSLRPPPAGATLTPVQVAVAGVFDLPPGERRTRVASLAAAAKLVAYMSTKQVNALLGRPDSLATTGSAVAYVTAQAIRTIGFGWVAGTINSARCTWLRLLAFAQRTNAMAGLDSFYFHGFIVSSFLSSVDADARAAYRLRHPGRPKHVMDAKGSAARGGQAAACMFLARNLTFPIQVDCKAVTLIARASRRRTTKQAPALGPRAIYVLCWLTEFGDSQFVRCHAAGWLALVHFALRLINAQRSCILSMVDDVVRGSCDLDAKMTAGEQNGRPMWAYRQDMRGKDLWLHLLLHMRDAPPRAPPIQDAGADVEDPHYFLRDTNASDGDPSSGKATAWVDWPLGGQRATASLRALVQLSPWGIPREVAMEKTGHSAKHDLVCVSRAGGDPRQDTNEIGKWSGSLAQSTDVASSTATVAMRARHGASSSEQDSAELAMAELYSAESVEEVVPAIMQRQIMRLQALVVSPGIDALPSKGGWRHIPRCGSPADSGVAQSSDQPLATAQHTSAAQHPTTHAQRTANHSTPLPLIPYVPPDGGQHPQEVAAGGVRADGTSGRQPPTVPPSAMRMRHAGTQPHTAIIPYQRPALVAGAKDPAHQHDPTHSATLPSRGTRGALRRKSAHIAQHSTAVLASDRESTA